MNLVFEFPIDFVLAGVRGFLPVVYIDEVEIEYDKEYPVKLKLASNNPPRERLEGSILALYMLLYPIKPTPIVKLGSISMHNSSAAMLWAQAPVYARIVGIFHLKKTIGLESLESFSRELLRTRYTTLFKFITRRDSLFNSYKIIEMWTNSDWDDVEKLISEVDNIAEYLIVEITRRLNYIETLYDGVGFETPRQRVELPSGFKTLSSLRDTLKKKRRGVKGLFKVTPVGLCIFTQSTPKDTESRGNALFVDICREFAYNTKVFLASGSISNQY